MVIYIDPARNLSLTKITTMVIKLSEFDWFVLQSPPFRVVVSVVKIYVGYTNQIVSKKIVIVINLNF